MIYSIYSAIQDKEAAETIPFHKFRVIVKCTCLAFAYLNPLYIFMSLIFLDICLLVIENILKR